MQRYQVYGIEIESDFPFANRLGRPGIDDASSDQAGESALRVDDLDLTFVCQSTPPFLFYPASMAPAYESPFLDETGEPLASIFRFEHCDVLHYPRLVDFYVGSKQITAHLVDPSHSHTVEIYLLGTVFSFLLERHRIPMLHASAVDIGGDAVAFLSSNKGGKSGLAATLMQGGRPLLTDDVLPIELLDNAFVGRSGYPTMRMWPDEAQHFLGQYESFELVHPQLDKRRIPVGPDGFGTFCAAQRPLKAIYLPERREPSEWGDSISIEPVSPVNAVIEMVRNSFIARTVQAMGWQPQRLSLFTRLAQQVPMRRLIYPSGFEHLPRVREALSTNLDQS